MNLSGMLYIYNTFFTYLPNYMESISFNFQLLFFTNYEFMHVLVTLETTNVLLKEVKKPQQIE